MRRGDLRDEEHRVPAQGRGVRGLAGESDEAEGDGGRRYGQTPKARAVGEECG